MNNHVLNDARVEAYMQRALDLARLGAGVVAPNPMVGCVIDLEQQHQHPPPSAIGVSNVWIRR